MDGFSGYNQINILYLPINTKPHSFVHGGLFLIKNSHLGLKNVGATFQRAMSYAFHDIKHIVQPYLDDFPAHSLTSRRSSHAFESNFYEV
jgi:hypothetical protein